MADPEAEQQQQQQQQTKMKKQRTTAAEAGGASASFPDIVTLVHTHLAPMLKPQDAYNLLASCTGSLNQDVRDGIATKALLYYYKYDSAHFGLKCGGDWHQLIPVCIQGARGLCACNWDDKNREDIIPEDVPLPKVLDARTQLLGAMHLLYEGIRPFRVVQMYRGRTCVPATMQPVVFSLAEAYEKVAETAKPIDTDNIEELARLMNAVEPGFGTHFFIASDEEPVNVLEAHWKGIQFDEGSGATTCEFCENYEQSPHFVREHGVSQSDSDGMMRAHCAEFYQPMKKLMLQKLKHVRYVQPRPEWNPTADSWARRFGLIAGFTRGGVLCGVYVTSIGIPTQWIKSRLAPGHFSRQRGFTVYDTPEWHCR